MDAWCLFPSYIRVSPSDGPMRIYRTFSTIRRLRTLQMCWKTFATCCSTTWNFHAPHMPDSALAGLWAHTFIKHFPHSLGSTFMVSVDLVSLNCFNLYRHSRSMASY